MWLRPASSVALSAPGLPGPAQGNSDATGASRSGLYAPKQKLLLTPLQEVVWSLTVGAHQKL